MDKVDLLILSYLKNNARMKASDIGKEINFSVSSVIERIKKLEKSGIIEKYTIQLDDKKIGNNITAFMEVTLSDEMLHDMFENYVSGNKNILSCYYIAGDYDFLLKIKTHDSEQVEKIHREIKSFKGIKSVKTSFSMREVKFDFSSIPDED